MGEFSITHLLLLGIIALIFFGPSRLPALGQSLGKAIRGFKQGLNEADEVRDAHLPPVNPQQQIPQQQQQSIAFQQQQQNPQQGFVQSQPTDVTPQTTTHKPDDKA
jgi:sec-independent protein translocase protein TatA